MTRIIRTILADDHPLFLDALQTLLEKYPSIQVVGATQKGEALLNLVEQHKPDIVITDIRIPGMDGITLTRQLRLQHPQLGILVLTLYQEERLILETLEAGANGYLLKSATTAELLQAITTVASGDYYFCNETNLQLSRLIAGSCIQKKKGPLATFSEKELDVMRLICQQYASKEIADLLQLTKRTVEKYRDRIMNKTDARNMVGIVIYAIQHNIFTIGEDVEKNDSKNETH